MAASGRVDELKKRYEENPRRFFAPLANEYRKSGDLELAIDLCRKHLSESPQNLSGQIVFGQALFDAGSLDEAESAFGTAISLDPENLIALRHLGDIARAQNDSVRARLWYQRVIDADPRNDEVASILAELPAAEATAPDAPASAADQPPAEALEIEPTSLAPEAPPAEPEPAPLRPTPAVVTPAPAPRPVSQSEVKTLEIPAMRRPKADAEAISFGDEPAPSAELPAAEPPSPPSVGFNVDFAAAAGLGMSDEPMMGAVGESSAFGEIDVPTETPFGTAEDFAPESPFGTGGRGKGGAARFGSRTPQRTPPVPPPVVDRAPAEDESAAVGEAEAPAAAAPAAEAAAAEAAVVEARAREAAPPPRPATPVPPTPAVEPPTSKPESLDFEVVEAAPPVRPREMPPRLPAAAAIDEFELEPAETATPPADDAPPPEPESFATETMAELYLKQGLRQKAIDVYRELIRARPGDDALKARLTELESDGRGATRLTARTFFSGIASRRATPTRQLTPPRESAAVAEPRASVETPLSDAPPPDDVDSSADDAPAALPFIDTSEPDEAAAPETGAPPAQASAELDDEEPSEEAERPARPTIDALFGNADVAAMDDTAAHSLAAAFGGPRADVSGRPARAASDEVSLDEVFRRARNTPSGSLAVPRQSATLRFDQFFAGGSAESAPSQPDASADQSGDSEQFQAWLNGLKKQ